MDEEPKFSGYISFGMMSGILLMGIGLGWGFGIDNVLNATSNFLYIFGIALVLTSYIILVIFLHDTQEYLNNNYKKIK